MNARAWTVPANTQAQNGARAIHSQSGGNTLLRAETIRVSAGKGRVTIFLRAKGTLRLEGKGHYIVKDGDVMHVKPCGG